jgi:hypothetical protein
MTRENALKNDIIFVDTKIRQCEHPENHFNFYP